MSEPTLKANGFFFGTPIILACDGQCQKAWGINNRPKIYLQGEEVDPDDYCFLADGELGIAPEDPGTREGDEWKPRRPEERLNKWCARECERGIMLSSLEDWDLEYRDFSQRLYNRAPHSRPDESLDGA